MERCTAAIISQVVCAVLHGRLRVTGSSTDPSVDPGCCPRRGVVEEVTSTAADIATGVLHDEVAANVVQVKTSSGKVVEDIVPRRGAVPDRKGDWIGIGTGSTRRLVYLWTADRATAGRRVVEPGEGSGVGGRDGRGGGRSCGADESEAGRYRDQRHCRREDNCKGAQTDILHPGLLFRRDYMSKVTVVGGRAASKATLRVRPEQPP